MGAAIRHRGLSKPSAASTRAAVLCPKLPVRWNGASLLHVRVETCSAGLRPSPGCSQITPPGVRVLSRGGLMSVYQVLRAFSAAMPASSLTILSVSVHVVPALRSCPRPGHLLCSPARSSSVTIGLFTCIPCHATRGPPGYVRTFALCFGCFGGPPVTSCFKLPASGLVAIHNANNPICHKGCAC